MGLHHLSTTTYTCKDSHRIWTLLRDQKNRNLWKGIAIDANSGNIIETIEEFDPHQCTMTTGGKKYVFKREAYYEKEMAHYRYRICAKRVKEGGTVRF